jgi:hypothetical protein
MAWLLLPPLFSLIIIILLAYMSDHFIYPLEIEANRVPQSSEFRAHQMSEVADAAALAVPEASVLATKIFHRAPKKSLHH